MCVANTIACRQRQHQPLDLPSIIDPHGTSLAKSHPFTCSHIGNIMPSTAQASMVPRIVAETSQR
ncbi:hypothetical protein BR93DRAFT_932320 [Coniochaeta sp. PMI_546]|nr:hypothetical protein BR93DRAFT_932320 [Coniochaeta sp. PMI_546]